MSKQAEQHRVKTQFSSWKKRKKETFNFDECFLILKSTTPSTILKRNVAESFSL